MSEIKPNLVLIGGGGHCVSVIDIIENGNEFNILGIKDDKQAAIKRLENKRDTLLLEVKETEHTEAEKEAIVKLYAKKIDDINNPILLLKKDFISLFIIAIIKILFL